MGGCSTTISTHTGRSLDLHAGSSDGKPKGLVHLPVGCGVQPDGYHLEEWQGQELQSLQIRGWWASYMASRTAGDTGGEQGLSYTVGSNESWWWWCASHSAASSD